MTTYAAAADLHLRITDSMALRALEDAQPDPIAEPEFEGMAWPEIVAVIDEHEREDAYQREAERALLREERSREYYGY